MAVCVRGDALKPEEVSAVFDQIEDCDAVVSSIGGALLTIGRVTQKVHLSP